MDALKRELAALQKATKGCRDDMQGLSVQLTLGRLDNAGGLMEAGFNLYQDGKALGWFNLATVIALARKAKL